MWVDEDALSRLTNLMGGTMPDSGHEAVGQALLISGVSLGALGAAALSGFILRTFEVMITSLG